jgi:hypothetical protein
MESPPESIGAATEPQVNGRSTTHDVAPIVARGGWRDRATLALAYDRFRLAIWVYLATRVLLVLVALFDVAFRHGSFINETANWDGGWYRALATDGYKHQVLHDQETLGFFPLYSMLLWLGSAPFSEHAEIHAAIITGYVISLIGGLIATVLIQRLASGWWGESAGRRAAVLFCLFPGSVVFSMVYAEGIMLPLAIGCILALQHRRWMLAGLLAAFATASEPEAAVLIVVCAVSAAREIYRRGWGDTAARRSLLAPLLAPLGLIGVIAFMWSWTGSPTAYWTTQHYGWRERFDLLALPHLAIRLAHHISFAHFNHPTINLNWPVGLVGAVILIVLLVLMLRIRGTISLEAWLWTLGISFIAVTSEWVPPNPRLLITAFPAVIVPAYYLRRRAFGWLLVANGFLLVVMSAVTFVGVTLRP